MYPLMSLKIMIAIETLGTLVASERPVVLRARLLWMTVELLDMRSVSAVEAWHHAVWHAANHLELTVWIANI